MTKKHNDTSKFNIETIANNAWIMLFFNFCSLVGLIVSCVTGNETCILVFSILVAVLIFTISIYLVYRVFAVKRAKANIQKINLAINKEIGEKLHRFFHDLRDCNSFWIKIKMWKLRCFEIKLKIYATK